MTARELVVMAGVLVVSSASLRAQAPSRPRTTSCVDSISHDTTVYDPTQLTEVPLVRRAIPPMVPIELLRPGVKLQVMLSLIIGPDGKVEPQSIAIVDSSHTAFDREAVRVGRATEFWPGCRYTQAVRVRALFPVTYHTLTGR